MNKVITLLILLFAWPVHAYEFAEKWTWEDTAFESVFVVLAVVDWGQTRWMAERNYKWDGIQYPECNPILGNKPSTGKVDFLIPLGIIFHGFISMALPSKYHVIAGEYEYDIYPRKIWQYIWIGFEGATVLGNNSLGARIEF